MYNNMETDRERERGVHRKSGRSHMFLIMLVCVSAGASPEADQ